MKHRSARGVLGAAAITVALATVSQAAVIISTDPTNNEICSGGVCTPTAMDAVLNVTELANMLATSDVKVISDNVAMDIELKAPLIWTSSSRLTLDAYRTIEFRRPMTIAGTGGLTLDDGGTSGSISFIRKMGYVEFWDLASNLTINGQSFTLVNDITSLASAVSSDFQGHYAMARSYDASVDGTYSEAPIQTVFWGTFEGLGNEIANLTISNPSPTGYIGFFREIENSGTIRDFTLRNIHATGGNATVGGLVGVMGGGTILSSFVTGTLKSLKGNPSQAIVGGLAAALNNYYPTTIINSGADVTAIAPANSWAGGLVGRMFGGQITQSWSGGVISVHHSYGNEPATSAGGLVGYIFEGEIANCYSTASATAGKGANAGGLVGVSYEGVVQDSYAIGAVTSGTGYRGGLIGYAYYANNTVDDYWDTTTSGISDLSQGVGNIPNAPGVTGLTTAELQSGLPQGFSRSIWFEKAGINDGLPYLRANQPEP